MSTQSPVLKPDPTASVAFSAESEARITELLGRYPERRAALIPVLRVAQEQFGWISHEVMALVARTLELPEPWVYSTATFYTMFHKRPVGRHHIQVCTNIACYLRGADELMAVVRDELGIADGETTADGEFTVESVQCLAACGFAPAMQIGKRDFFHMTPEQLRATIRELKGSAPPLNLAPPAVPSPSGAADA